MNKEEFTEKVKQINSEIEAKKEELLKIRKEYSNENSPLKIGDKIIREGKEGIISDVDISCTFPDCFKYKWKPFKKDGSLSYERDLWGKYEKL